MSTVMEPIWVGDADTDAWQRFRKEHRLTYEATLDWARNEGIRVDDTIVVEVYLIDGPSAKVTEMLRDDTGQVLVDSTGEEALTRTYEIPLYRLPPTIEDLYWGKSA